MAQVHFWDWDRNFFNLFVYFSSKSLEFCKLFLVVNSIFELKTCRYACLPYYINFAIFATLFIMILYLFPCILDIASCFAGSRVSYLSEKGYPHTIFFPAILIYLSFFFLIFIFTIQTELIPMYSYLIYLFIVCIFSHFIAKKSLFLVNANHGIKTSKIHNHRLRLSSFIK